MYVLLRLRNLISCLGEENGVNVMYQQWLVDLIKEREREIYICMQMRRSARLLILQPLFNLVGPRVKYFVFFAL